MSTRQELLQNFINYPDGMLEKLHTIAQSILTPLDNQLTSVDYASMVDMVFKQGGLAEVYFPTWTDKSKADFGRFLVELFALFSDKDFFYINHLHNESFGTTCEMYRNLVHHAISNGYKPEGNVASQGTFNLTFNAGIEEAIERGAIEVGLKDFPDLTFSNEYIIIPQSAGDLVVSCVFKNGIINKDYGNFNGISIPITTEKVCEDSIQLTIDGESWTETDSFANGDASTKHFMVLYNEKGQADIRFARGGFGQVPTPDISYEVSYRVGGGTIGDLTPDVLKDTIKDDSTRKIKAFYQPQTTGGANLEALETLRQRYVSFQRHLNRIIHPEDAEKIALELDMIYKVKGIGVSNYLFLYTVPKSDYLLSPSQRTSLEQYILPKILWGYGLQIVDPNFIKITMQVDIYVLPETSNSAAFSVATEVIKDYLDPLLDGQFGEGCNRSRLSARLLRRVVGCQNVDFNILYEGINIVPQPNPAASDIVINPYELIDYANSEININIIGGQ